MFVPALFDRTVNMALQGAWVFCSEAFNSARICNNVIGLLIGARLLLSTEAYELFGEGVEWKAFVILFASSSMTVAAFP
jgi:hypothetical protein